MATPPHDSAPAGGDGGTRSRAGTGNKLSVNVAPATDSSASGSPGNIARRRRWAYALIKRALSPPPTYGSADWLALVEGSPEKVAGVVVAAESWARGADDLEENLRRGIEDARAAFKATEDADYAARAAEHRERYERLGQVVSLAERRRRRVEEAGRPRPGDYPGGPVEWDGGAS